LREAVYIEIAIWRFRSPVIRLAEDEGVWDWSRSSRVLFALRDHPCDGKENIAGVIDVQSGREKELCGSVARGGKVHACFIA